MSFTQKYGFLVVLGRVLIDVCWILSAYGLAVSLTLPRGQAWSAHAYAHLNYVGTFVLVWCGVAADQGLFSSRRNETLVAILFSVAKAFFTSLLFSAFLIALFVQGAVDRALFLAFSVCAFGVVLAFTLVTRADRLESPPPRVQFSSHPGHRRQRADGALDGSAACQRTLRLPHGGIPRGRRRTQTPH